MANRYLGREDAPIAAETWEFLDSIVIQVAKSLLTGRRLLHVEGPYGLGLKAVALTDAAVEAGLITSSSIPLTFIHRTFTLSKRDLAAYERDKLLLGTKELVNATIECARAEDTLIFQGVQAAPGLLTVGGLNTLELAQWTEVGSAVDNIIRAMTVLDDAGFHGPYSLALAPNRYNLLFRRYPTGETTELEHIKMIATEGVFKAPTIEAGGVLLAFGPQFASIILGQDMSIGFIGPVGERLEFSISESLALLINAPRSICVLKG